MKNKNNIDFEGIFQTIGLVILVISVYFLGKFLYENYKNDLKELEYELKAERQEYIEAWNDGVCPKCKTEWHYKEAVGHSNWTSYIYECEQGHIVERDMIEDTSSNAKLC